MARWRLTNKHYLNVPGTEWEHRETSTTTGRQARTIYKVPMYIDPDDPSNHTPIGSGQVIVSYAKGAHPFDLIFEGQPTPEMEPLDEEAEKISAEWKDRWDHPIESLPAQGGFTSETKMMMEQFAAAIGTNISAGSVSAKDFETLRVQVAMLVEENTKLKAAQAVRKV